MSGGEFDLIRDLFRRRIQPAADLPVGIGDDGAVLRPSGGELAWVIDTINAGHHFPPDADGSDVGHRALAVNLSDMVAMGAESRWALLSLTLPESVEASWPRDFADGFLALAESAGVSLAGGDMTAGALAATVTLLGPISGQAVTRSGARPGDYLFVSGTLGDARAGLPLALGEAPIAGADDEWLLQRYRRPQPRLALSPVLGAHASAAIDISDGFCADLGHILEESGVGALINADDLPLSPALRARHGEKAVDWALAGGDDYEILCTVSPSSREALVKAAEEAGVPLAEVGRIREEGGLEIVGSDGQPLPVPGGFDHFDKD